jgi:transcriptional regulator with XRE-family HTH domain
MDGLRELGALVRRCRTDAGLSGAELARRAGVPQPSVWRVESGRRLSDVAVVERLAAALGLAAEAEEALADVARAAYGASARPRVDSGVSLIAGQFRRYLLDARLVRSFSSAAIPELLRTSEYAAAAGVRDVAGDPDFVPGLLADPERSFVFVVTEGALRTWPGGVDMAGQLGRVLALADRPNIRVGVIGAGLVPRVPLHGFTVLDERAVWVETFTAEVTLTHAGDVAAYAGCFAGFEGAAVFGEPARATIRRIAAEFAALSDT